MISRSTLMLNCLKLWNNGKWNLSWRWWPFTVLSTKLLKVMLLHWFKYSGRVMTCTTEEDEDCDISGTMPTIAPLLPRISDTDWCTFFWLPAKPVTIRLRIKVRLLWHIGTTKLWQRPLLKLNQNPALDLILVSCMGGWGLGKSRRGLVVGLHQEPVHTAIKASLTGRKRILNVIEKGKLRSLDFMILPQSKIKQIG